MNREIKFRAWHTTQKKMFPAKELGADQLTLSADGRGFVNCAPTLAGSVFFGEAIIPLQYTGLKDSRGKEIYEGDILVYRDNMSVDRPGVKFDSYSLVSFGNYDYGSYEQNESGYGWFLKPITDKEGLGLNANYSKLLEVIGNIYEYSHLLDK